MYHVNDPWTMSVHRYRSLPGILLAAFPRGLRVCHRRGGGSRDARRRRRSFALSPPPCDSLPGDPSSRRKRARLMPGICVFCFKRSILLPGLCVLVFLRVACRGLHFFSLFYAFRGMSSAVYLAQLQGCPVTMLRHKDSVQAAASSSSKLWVP